MYLQNANQNLRIFANQHRPLRILFYPDIVKSYLHFNYKLVLIYRDRTVAHLQEQRDTLDHIQRICAKLRLGREIKDLSLE